MSFFKKIGKYAEQADEKKIGDIVDKKLNENKKSAKKDRSELTRNQKMLLFEEFGFTKILQADEHLRNLTNKEKGILLAYIFGMKGDENIKKALSYSAERTITDLKKVLPILEELGLHEIADKYKNEITEKEQKKKSLNNKK